MVFDSTWALKHMTGIALIDPNQANSTKESKLALVPFRPLPIKLILLRFQNHCQPPQLGFSVWGESSPPSPGRLSCHRSCHPEYNVFLVLGEWELVYCLTQLMSCSLCFKTNREGRQQWQWVDLARGFASVKISGGRAEQVLVVCKWLTWCKNVPNLCTMFSFVFFALVEGFNWAR